MISTEGLTTIVNSYFSKLKKKKKTQNYQMMMKNCGKIQHDLSAVSWMVLTSSH